MAGGVRRSMLVALLAAVLGGPGCAARRMSGAGKGADMQTKTRGRKGTKQGPLLMGDDFARELRAKVRGAPAAGACPLAARLARLRAPSRSEWRFPQAPRVAGAQVRTPPFAAGCRTVGLGTGPVEAKVHKGRRGTFDVLCAAGSGQYAYTVSSPCIHYHAQFDGWVSVEFVVLLSGRVEVAPGRDGKAGVEIGLYAAHCWPKQKGKYWQESRFIHESDTAWSFKSMPVSHTALFPVERGVKYSFGVGLTTQAWARDGATAGCRVWGRLAYVVIRKLARAPAVVPYE